MAQHEEDFSGGIVSPGGKIFGIQGWSWGEPRPKAITFFTDGSCKVSDQHGRPIRGAVVDGKEVVFALCTHVQVLAALKEDGGSKFDWLKLDRAGWPQLPYEQLMALPDLPPWPFDDGTGKVRDRDGNIVRIRDPKLWKDALRAKRERDSARLKEQEAEFKEAEA